MNLDISAQILVTLGEISSGQADLKAKSAVLQERLENQGKALEERFARLTDRIIAYENGTSARIQEDRKAVQATLDEHEKRIKGLEDVKTRSEGVVFGATSATRALWAVAGTLGGVVLFLAGKFL